MLWSGFQSSTSQVLRRAVALVGSASQECCGLTVRRTRQGLSLLIKGTRVWSGRIFLLRPAGQISLLRDWEQLTLAWLANSGGTVMGEVGEQNPRMYFFLQVSRGGRVQKPLFFRTVLGKQVIGIERTRPTY